MPTVFIDSDLRRIYEVPDVPHSFVDVGGGLRRYTPTDIGAAPIITTMDLLADIYSPWVRHRDADDGDYAPIAFDRSGGAETGPGQNAPTELKLRNDLGWRLVLANYPHELNIVGNLRPSDAALLMFDQTPLTATGAYSRIESSANLITRTITVAGGNVITGDIADVPAAVQTGMTAQGYTPALATELDDIPTAVWDYVLP